MEHHDDSKKLEDYWTGRYSTIKQCIRDNGGRLKTTDTTTGYRPCYSAFYISICIMIQLATLEDRPVVEITPLRKLATETEGVMGYVETKILSEHINQHTQRDLWLQLVLLYRGLLTGTYNVYNRNCVLHCGSCGHCSNEADIQTLFDTRSTITKDMTACSIRYALPAWLGGHNDRRILEACLTGANVPIRFTPSCMKVWLDDIDCAVKSCKLACWTNFLPWNNKQSKTCIDCDEQSCGGNFIMHAGTNRRAAGITSDIVRDNTTLCTTGMYSKWSERLPTERMAFVKSVLACNTVLTAWNMEIEEMVRRIEDVITNTRDQSSYINIFQNMFRQK